MRGMGAEITDVTLDPRSVEIFVGNEIAPGFFAWIIPTNKKGTTARVGLCTTSQAPQPIKHYFTKMFTTESSAPFLRDGHVTRYVAGSVPLGSQSNHLGRQPESPEIEPPQSSGE